MTPTPTPTLTSNPFYLSAKTRSDEITSAKSIFRESISFQKQLLSNDNNNYKRRILSSIKINSYHSDHPSSPIFYNLRNLHPQEVAVLSSSNKCGCKVQDNNWSKVLLLIDDPNYSHHVIYDRWLQEQCTHNYFAGDIVVIGITVRNCAVFDEESPPSSVSPALVPLGLHNNGIVSNSIFMPGCRVYSNSVVENSFFYGGSILMNCGTVSTEKSALLSSGANHDAAKGFLKMTLGPEAGGGRDIEVCPEDTMIDVCMQLKLSPRRESNEFDSNEFMVLSRNAAPFNIFGKNSYAINTPKVLNVFMSSSSLIDAAASVQQIIMLSGSSIINGSVVEKAFLQWKAQISNGAHVNNSLLIECAAAETAAIVNSSVLGPDAHVGGGETQHTLLGK